MNKSAVSYSRVHKSISLPNFERGSFVGCDPPETDLLLLAMLPSVTTKKPLDDVWTYQQVKTPFPPNALRAPDQQNTYVALWYRHGKAFMGRAFNDSGVVQCEFAVDKKVYSDTDVGGTIQLLTYEGTHVSNSFFYEWIHISLWKSDLSNEFSIRQVVRCGSSAPVFWQEVGTIGNYDIDAQRAQFVVHGKFYDVADQVILSQMKILVRCTEGGPPHCPCNACNEKQRPTQKPLMVNDWGDFLYGMPYPKEKPLVKALGRPLKTPKGTLEQVVALWYRHGVPKMGRAWNSGGKLVASFSDNGHEVTGECVGSLQILVELPATAAGFDYIWLPYEQASKYQDKDYAPVHVSHVAPCVLLTKENHEVLGQVDLKKEKAEATFNGQLIVKEGPFQLNHLMVLCRRDRDDTFTI